MEQGKAVALGLALGAGGVGMVQVLVNSALGRVVGSYQAGLVSGIGTALTLALVSVFAGGFGRLGADPIPWHYLGGVLGAIYVTTALIAVQTLGAGGVTAATIAGQLSLSMALDRLGAFGLEQRELSVTRVLGVALLAAGTVLVVRD